MNLNEYQTAAGRTAHFPVDRALEYTTIAMCGEAGEFANVVKKVIRDNKGITDKRQDQLELELGDTLWYVSQAARAIGCDLQYIADRNLTKLAARQAQRERGEKVT